jgi:hypothetical protein
VVEAIRRQLPPQPDPDGLVFTGPGGGNGVPFGTRTTLSRHGFRRLYQTATHRARADLAHLQLRGPHDLRHSFSTWLEDEGIPARVIDPSRAEPGKPGVLARQAPHYTAAPGAAVDWRADGSNRARAGRVRPREIRDLLANLLASGPLERPWEAFSLVGVTGIEPVTSAV